MGRYIKISNEDGTYTDQRVYSSNDIQSFWIWANANGYYYRELTELWHNNYNDTFELTLDEIIKHWEESK